MILFSLRRKKLDPVPPMLMINIVATRNTNTKQAIDALLKIEL